MDTPSKQKNPCFGRSGVAARGLEETAHVWHEIAAAVVDERTPTVSPCGGTE